MTIEAFKEAVKNDGWITIRKGGYIYFKRRDVTKPYNQGAIYSCHTKDIDKAMKTIQRWIVSGFPATKEDRAADMLFVDYLYSFWSKESLYYKTAEIEGRHISTGYINAHRLFVRRYIEGYFIGKRLSDLSEDLLNRFFDWLFTQRLARNNRQISSCTVLKVRETITVAVKWGRRKGIIKQPIDFLVICPNVISRSVYNRGILTPQETAVLLAHGWSDRKAYIAFCIAVNCGLRLGEIRALRIENIQNGFIIVNKSYSDFDGLKGTKTGKARIVPCPDDLLALLADYVYSLPVSERGGGCYLLTEGEGEPLNRTRCTHAFYKAMRACGINRVRINPLTGKNEIICFHSLRHQTATRWVESGLDIRLIAQAMGHTVEMLQHYSDHLSIGDTERLRGGLLAAGVLGAGAVCGLPAPCKKNDA